MGSFLVEETDILLTYDGGNGGEPAHEKWKSVCVEGKRKKAKATKESLLPLVRAALGREVDGEDGDHGILPLSYPGFVAHAAARLIPGFIVARPVTDRPVYGGRASRSGCLDDTMPCVPGACLP